MRGLPFIRSLKAAVFMSVLMLSPLFLLPQAALTGVYGIFLCVFLAPALVTVAALWGGLLPALSGVIAAVLMAGLSFGRDAGLLMALYMLPPFAAFLICTVRGQSFFKTAFIMALSQLAGAYAVLMIGGRMTNGDLSGRLAEQFCTIIDESGMRDQLLVAFLRSGMARLDTSLYPKAVGLTGGLTDLAREELYLSLKATLTEYLSLLPAMMISLSIWHSLGGLGFGVYFGRRSVICQVVDRRRAELMQQVIQQRRMQLERGEAPEPVRLESREQLTRKLQKDCETALVDFPQYHMPPFSAWHLPRRVGLMAAIPALGYLVVLSSDAPQAVLVGQMLISLFTALYTIQGLAAMDYLLGQAGRGLWVRGALLAAGMLFFSRALLFIGVLDQLMNFRKLRPPLGGTEEPGGRP